MRTRTKVAKLNICTAFSSQIVTIVCGLILPRVMLSAFGSEGYGAASSITQFLAYISLLEGGICGVARAALYKPLAENEYDKVGQILQQLKKFFNCIAYIFLIYVVILASTFKYLAHVECFDWLFTFCLVISISISTFAQYFIGIKYSVFLQAAQKTYITTIISLVAIILNTVLTIILVHYGLNLVIVKFASSCVYALRPIVLWLYVKWHYTIPKVEDNKENLLPQKWEALAQHFAFFIHSNTDIVVLTILSNLKSVAVYSVYSMIVSSMQGLVTSFTSGMEALFGDMIAKNEKSNLNKTFGTYETLISITTIVAFSTTLMLIVPFVVIYTRNINDANYSQPVFAILMIAASVGFCFRQPYHAVVNAAGKFKETRLAAFGEALINLGVSIILVRFIGLVGVAVGTFAAVLFRFIYYVIFLNKNIMQLKIVLVFKRMIINTINIMLLGLFAYIIGNSINLYTFFGWIAGAITMLFISTCLTCLINYCFYRNDFITILYKIRRR
ncbi:lipopolysaccharide biosynthesis protein [Coprococcus catus]